MTVLLGPLNAAIETRSAQGRMAARTRAGSGSGGRCADLEGGFSLPPGGSTSPFDELPGSGAVLGTVIFLYGGQPYRGSTRDYWLQYPTVTKLSVGVSQGFTRSVTAFVRAENIGNSLRAEETNANLSTPRSLLVGATVRY